MRKLYKVIVRPKWWMDDGGPRYKDSVNQSFIIEAETHEQAANEAARKFNAAHWLHVEATHVPFTKIETIKSGVAVEDFKGDGTETFDGYQDLREYVWKKRFDVSLPLVATGLIAGILGIVIGVSW